MMMKSTRVTLASPRWWGKKLVMGMIPLLLFSVGCAIDSIAQTTTVTFETSTSASAIVVGDYTVEDYHPSPSFPSVPLKVLGTAEGYANKVIQTDAWNRNIRLRKTNNTVFTLTSFQHAEGQWGSNYSGTVRGTFQNGTTQSITISATTKTLQTVTVNWANLTKVEFLYPQAYGVLDNIVVSGTSTPCTFSASPTQVVLPSAAAASNQSIAITASATWSASTTAPWITLTSASGSGNGSVTYSVVANTGTTQRSGTINITGCGTTSAVAITQPAPISVSPTSCGSITNNGFENGLNGWINDGNTIISTDEHSGANATLTGPGAGGLHYGSSISAMGGQTVTFTVWGKISGTSSFAGLGLDYLNGAGAELSEAVINITSTSYSEYTLKATVPAGTTNIRVWTWKSGATGNLFLDDFCLTVSGSNNTDSQAPSIPANLTSTNVTSTSFTLSWAASSDNTAVTGYEVFRNGTSIGTPTTTSFNVTGLTASTAYAMTVRARDAAPNWSEQSTVLNVTTSPTDDTQAPSVPANLSSTNITQSGFTLSWTASTDNTAVTGYEVFLNGTSIGTPTTTSFNVTGLTASTAYAMTVRARDAVNNWSAQSVALNVTTAPNDTQAPSIPANVSSSNITQSGFTLSWTASTDDVAVTGYEVFRNGTSVATSTTTSFNVTGLVAGTTYAMSVRARDAAGNFSAQSVALNVTTSNNSTPTARVNNIGINIYSGGLDYNYDKPWADAMRSHRWIAKAQNKTSNDDASKDANYWPTEDAEFLVWAGLNTHNNHGTYQLSFTGSATITATTGTIQNAVYNAATNTTTASLVITDPNNEMLYLTFRNTRRTPTSATNTGITNVKLMRPVTAGSAQSYPADRVFTDQFMNALSSFTTVRYMDFTITNAAGDEIWSDRTKWTDARQGPPEIPGRSYGWQGRGPAWESVIMMANATGKDAWISIPHKVDDDYITNLAKLFRDGNEHTPGLNPNLKLIVEYSNEIWNYADAFPQTAWVNAAAVAYGHPLNFDGVTDQYTLGMRYKAMRTVRISDIFRSTFGDAQMMTRIRPVLEWQKGYTDMTNRAIGFIDRYYNKRDSRSDYATPHPVNYYLWGGGGSTYFYPEGVPTLDQIWNSGTFNPSEFYATIDNDAVFAKVFGLHYVAYEGNAHPHYGGDVPVVSQAVRDPRMKDELKEHHYEFNKLDGELLCYFNTTGTPFGFAPDNLDDLTTPHFLAVAELNAETPKPVNYGPVPPFSKPGAAYDVLGWHEPNPNGTGGLTLTASGEDYSSGYAFHVNTTGNYSVQIEYSTTRTATLVVEYEGNIVQTFNLANSNGAAVNTTSFNIACTADKLYGIRLVCTSGAVNIRLLKVNPSIGQASAARESESQISVSPNPIGAGENIDITGLTKNVQTSIQVVDLSGVVIRNETTETGSISHRFNTTGLQQGIYILKVTTNGNTVNKRIVVK